MKVRTKLTLSAALPALVAVAVSLVLSLIFQLVNELSVTLKNTDSVVGSTFDLSHATYRYLVSPDPDSQAKWHRTYDELGAHIAKGKSIKLNNRFAFWAPLNFDRLMDDRNIREDIKGNYNRIGELFAGIESAPAGNLLMANAEIFDEQQTLMTRALTLANVTRDGASAVQNTAYMTVVMVSAALALLLAMISVFLASSVSRGFLELEKGMDLVGQGGTATRIPVRGRDELSRLAAVFNKMSHDVVDARSALEKEIVEHKNTTAALRETNQQLSDVLVRLERAQQQVIQRERLQALQQISYGVVHDFNSALTPILGMSEYLLTDRKLMESNQDLEESITVINEAAQRSRDVIRNLVEFFSPGRHSTTDQFDLNAVVLRAVEVTGPTWKELTRAKGKPVNLSAQLSPTPLLLTGKESEIEEALVNLILNAVEALPEGGDIRLNTSKEGAVATLEIADSGEGMPQEIQARCFEPFFSTKPKDSSGMGLTATRAIVSRHRGEIALTSESGKGTTVSLRFPIAAPAPAPAATPPRPPAEASLRVLVIDDETWACRIIQKFLAGPNAIITACYNGREGVDAFKSGDYDIVVLDRAMPDISGDEAAIQLKAISPKTPIVMLTGFADLMKERGENPPGVDCVLGKPCTREELKTAIDTAMKKYA